MTMSFLQPFILWGLPLLLLPLVIHLFNRMRYRSMPWAAMMFLLSASRQSRRQARLRHFLILLCRMLAVAALILALSRPLVGGWLGWAMSAAPDTILLLLDRSASMELQDPVTQITKRQAALRHLTESARHTGAHTRWVLIESASRLPQQLSSPSVLPELFLAGPTDTAADIPAMLESAADYIVNNRAGKSEIWLVSDLQASNWRSDSAAWQQLRERFASMPQEPRVRLLALTQPAPENMAVTLSDVQRHRGATGYELHLVAELSRVSPAAVEFPLAFVHEGARTLLNLKMDSQHLRIHHKLDLAGRGGAGWGWVELPADANLRDNVYYFVYGEALHLKSVVVGERGPARRLLQLACAPAPQQLNQSSAVITPAEAAELDPAEVALLVWQAPLPSGRAEAVVRSFVEGGGVAIFYPPAAGDSHRLWQMGWGEVETAGEQGGWRAGHWRNDDGPLARTLDGNDLPVGDLVVTRRQAIIGEAGLYAVFDDGRPLLARISAGRGAAYFCATLPHGDWSTLGEGTVLVPMMQRLLTDGGRRLSSVEMLTCGEPRLGDPHEIWTRLDGRETAPAAARAGEELPATPLTQAGVWQSGVRTIAVNRPRIEDAPEILDEPTVRSLFGAVPFRFFEERQAGTARLQAEMWRTFLWIMLALLVAEAALSLPGGRVRRGDETDTRRGDATAGAPLAARQRGGLGA
jgi:hypothetical protein